MPGTPAIEYRAEVPEASAFVRLFATTGWDPAGRLSESAAAAALARTWYAISAYEGDRLVGTGRIVGDGVLHALLADVIVDPAARRRGIGSGSSSAWWRSAAGSASWTCSSFARAAWPRSTSASDS